MLAKEPWNLPLTERLYTLNHPSEKRKVLYLYEQPDYSTFRYRVYNVFQALNLSENWQGSYFFANELELIETSLKNIDLLVVCRFRWSFTLNSFLTKAKQAKIPIAFDVDDLVFDIEQIPLIINSLGVERTEERFSYWFSYVSRLQLTAQQCHAAISTNSFISEKITSKFQIPCHIIPNFLNREQLERSQSLYKAKTNLKKKGKFAIGYFSGTPSHKDDFATVIPEVFAFLNDHSHTQLNLAGYMELPKSLNSLLTKKQIVQTPFVDFVTLQDNISKVDVNIVPLIDNAFTNCKSELKFFEAAVVGTPTCAKPLHVFSNNIQHEKTGFLCQEGQWYDTLKRIHDNSFDPSLNEKAKDYCINKYAYFNQSKNIEEVFEKILSSR